MSIVIRDQDILDYHSLPIPGKLEIQPTKPCLTQRDLSIAYSPGVALPCLRIEANPDDVYRYTARGNLVAVISNGTAVLGLGAIGALASKPVMEGKAILFKRFAGIDVFDIEVDTTDSDAFVNAVALLEPTFGGINLEDIKAPECFEIERALQARMNIPVFHDDQHGTAIISGAALINALEIVGKPIGEAKIVVCGAGAAGIASARFHVELGVDRARLLLVDSKGVIHAGRTDLNEYKLEFARETDARTLADAVRGADVFIGCSTKDMLTPAMLRTMAERPIVFAMANPDPEIAYELAVATRPDAIVATGRSDYPNQVNNALCFPFLFRGALDVRARAINAEMKRAAARALALLARESVPEVVTRAYGGEALTFGDHYIIPKPFDPRVLTWVAPAVARAAAETGVARAPIADLEAYAQELEQRVLGRTRAMHAVMSRARAGKKRIVLPEGEELKILQAAQAMRDQRLAEPVLFGDPARISAMIEEAGLDLEDVEIKDPRCDPEREAIADELALLRHRRGVTPVIARRLLADPAIHALMMLRRGALDGVVCGINRSYAQTIRPALQIVGLAPGFELACGMYLLGMKQRLFVFADATINIEPTADELAHIAVYAARAAARMFELVPRVAMLSFSNFGASPHPLSDKVARATELVRKLDPTLVVDGELTADVAIDAYKAKAFPHSAIQGDANVLVFPDLQSGNIAYRLVQHLTQADLVGPILVGLARSVGVVNHYSSVDEITNIAAITAVLADGKSR